MYVCYEIRVGRVRYICNLLTHISNPLMPRFEAGLLRKKTALLRIQARCLQHGKREDWEECLLFQCHKNNLALGVVYT